jgi:hypothetical protein
LQKLLNKSGDIFRRLFNMANMQHNGKTVRREPQQILDHARVLVDATSEETDDQITSAKTALKEHLETAKSQYDEVEARLLDMVLAADG